MNKVLVRFTNKASVSLHEETLILKKVGKWIIKTIPYTCEWAYVNGGRVGIYLEPEDAILFRIMFGDELV